MHLLHFDENLCNLAGALSQEPLSVWSIQSLFPGKKATKFWRGSESFYLSNSLVCLMISYCILLFLPRPFFSWFKVRQHFRESTRNWRGNLSPKQIVSSLWRRRWWTSRKDRSRRDRSKLHLEKKLMLSVVYLSPLLTWWLINDIFSISSSFISLFHLLYIFLFVAQILRFRLNVVHLVLGVLFLFGYSK